MKDETNITAFGNDTGVIVEDSSCAINNAILYGNSVTNLDGTGVFTGPVTYSMFQTAGELTSWPSPTNVSGDPMILTYQANLSPDLWDVHVAPGGTPLGIGDPAILNSNGTRSDIGRHGGPAGDADWYDDDDSDFLADGWERNFFGPNTSLFDAFDDPDGDGVDNTGELLSGTHPLNSDTDGDSWSDDIDNAPLNPQSH